MPSPTTPTHGLHGAIYRLRPNNFKGNGLNDLTWGTGYSGGGSSAYFEVEIDGEGSPDTFQWRKDGGAWTTDVSITGAAQTLSDSQTVTFGATTGHSSGDSWAIGNLDTEACTESSDEAQITDTSKRIINPNAPPTWTDSGGETLLRTDFSQAKGYFSGNVAAVTVSGNNGYVVESGLEKVGYLLDWSFEAEVDFSDITAMGDRWEDQLAGIARARGSANAFFIGCDSFFEDLKAHADGSQDYFFLQLFNYDPDQDQTGDHFNCWVNFTNLNINAPIGEVVREPISFKVSGIPSFNADA